MNRRESHLLLNVAQMDENLTALDAGPLDADEMARIRRIGKHIYGK